METATASLAERAVTGARQTIEGVLLPIAGNAAKRYFATATAMAGLTLVLVIVAVVVAAPAPWWGMSLAVAIALSAGSVGGLVLAPKRAVSGAIADGIERTGLGKIICGLIFQRLLGVSEDDAHGERGLRAAQRAERLPLAAAEERLRSVVDRVARDPGEGTGVAAWLRRKIRGALLEQIEGVTLVRFREEQQRHGGVDLVKVESELATTVDRLLVERFEDAAATTTYLVLAGVALASLGSALAVRFML